MTKRALILFGLLDLVSFVVTFKFVTKVIENIDRFSLLSIPEILLIVSLIASGVLSIMRKKISLIIYSCQFRLRVSFMILIFGFPF